ncbi:MAG: hypothetical protein ABIH21_01495, partial [Patescibacteria group bacterium]
RYFGTMGGAFVACCAQKCFAQLSPNQFVGLMTATSARHFGSGAARCTKLIFYTFLYFSV